VTVSDTLMYNTRDRQRGTERANNAYVYVLHAALCIPYVLRFRIVT